MRDEQTHLQLFDLIARDWKLASPARQIIFNRDDSAVAFACADGSIRIAATADEASPDKRIRRAVDTGRLTIAPRGKPVAPPKFADFADGRTSPVVPLGATEFAFGKSTGRINSLTPGGIAVHLPVRATGPISALAATPDGMNLAYACDDRLFLTPTQKDTPHLLATLSDITGLAFSPDGTTLAVAHGGGLSRWRLDRADAPPVHTQIADQPNDVSWSRDGAWLSTCLSTDGFCVVDAHRNKVHQHGRFPAPVRSVGVSGMTGTVVASGAFRVAGWALADQAPVTTGKAGLVLVDAVAASPSRNLVAVGYANGLLSLAEIGRPTEMLLREDTGAGITTMTWSGNGNYLALAGADGSAALVEFPDSMFKS